MKNLKILLCALIAPICLAMSFVFGSTAQVLAQDNAKTFNYVVSMSNGGLNVVGKFADNTTYPIAQGISLENVAPMIDADRFTSSGFEDANIHFQNVTVADNYLHLSNGNLTLSGALSGTGYSTYGLVFVDGASVRFENCTLSNNGLSYLVKNVGVGSLQFAGGTYSANSTLITSRGAGSVEILGGTFSSANASVIDFQPSSAAVVAINQAQNAQTKIVAKGAQPAIVAKNGEVRVLGGAIESRFAENAIALNNAPLVLANAPSIISRSAQIQTNAQIFASYFSSVYNGEKLLVDFTGEVVSGQTVLIKNGDVEFFELANAGFLLKQSFEDCIVCKFSTLSYQDPRGFITRIPFDATKYLMNDIATLADITENDVLPQTMDKYRFMGWSFAPNATSADLPANSTLQFAEDDITLYAVWQVYEFIITYENLQGAQNDNPTTYTTEDTIEINAPVRDLYVFKGWKVNGLPFEQANYTIRAGSFGALTLEAVWDYKEFEIVYHNITENDVQNLNLATTYTIISSPLEISLSDVLCKGYAFFGLYLDEGLSIPLPEIIYFDDWQSNSQEFLDINDVGQTINIYIDTRPYSNGTGDGTQDNPYIVENQAQFLALFIGEKVEADEPINITLAQNLLIDENLQGKFTGFEDFVIDGASQKLDFAETAFASFNGQITFVPEITNCTIKNLQIEFANQNISKAQSFQFSALAGNIENSILENVSICGEVDLTLDNPSATSTLKFGGLAITATGSEFINVNSQINFNASCNAQSADINIYGAGFVGFSADSCKLINCQNSGNIALDVQNNGEAFVYVSAVANLGENSKIWNCLNKGNINATAEDASGILCGVMAFGANNALYNVVNLGSITKDAPRVLATPHAYAGAGVVEQKNVFTTTDFATSNVKTTLQKLSNGVAALSGQTSAPLNVWYAGDEGIGFASGLVVNFVGNGIMPNQTHHFESAAQASKKFIWFDTQKYLFQGWFLADGTPVDWENITSQQVTVYAKYIPFEDLVQQQQTIAVGIAIGLFLIFIFILYLFDKKKPVRYFYKGEWIDTRRFGRTKTVTLPPEFEGRICFLDQAGEKPFFKKKMPCHKITLSVFEDEKQNRLEEFWNQFFELKKNKKEEKKLKKIKNKEEKIKKQQEVEKQKEKQKKKQKAKSNKKQTNIAKKSSKKKVIKNSNDSKITITKQEIKMKKK